MVWGAICPASNMNERQMSHIIVPKADLPLTAQKLPRGDIRLHGKFWETNSWPGMTYFGWGADCRVCVEI